MALCGIHDSGIRVGDRVLVTGLGAIGLMAAQLARLQGAGWVVCSDPIARRRELATTHGADLVIDPTAEDVGLTVKRHTGGQGADVSVEASGSYAALHDALRATAYGGTVASLAYYTGTAEALHLQGEWHRNQLTLISSRNVNDPLRADPRWDSERMHRQVIDLLVAGAAARRRPARPDRAVRGERGGLSQDRAQSRCRHQTGGTPPVAAGRPRLIPRAPLRD